VHIEWRNQAVDICYGSQAMGEYGFVLQRSFNNSAATVALNTDVPVTYSLIEKKWAVDMVA